jgi:hypothetical protein
VLRYNDMYLPEKKGARIWPSRDLGPERNDLCSISRANFYKRKRSQEVASDACEPDT